MNGILEWPHALLYKKDKREVMMTQDALRKKAENIVQSVINFPEARLQLRKRFYREFGHRIIVPYGYGKLELDFMEWEIKRGVLNPLNDPDQPGNPWWRRVNEQLMYYSELAGLAIAQEKQFTDIHERKPAYPDISVSQYF